MLYHGDICNYRCEYCTVGENGRTSTWVEQNPDKVIEFFRSLPPSVICLTGGEPSTWREIDNIINSLDIHDFMLWTNLSILREWMFVDSLKLIHAAYHFGFSKRDKFISNLTELTMRGKRVIVKIMAKEENYAEAAALAQEINEIGCPYAFTPIFHEGVTYSDGFLKTVLEKHLTSTMYQARYFLTDNHEHIHCSAGTPDGGIQLNPDGTLSRCFSVPLISRIYHSGSILNIQSSIVNSAILPTSAEPCSRTACWCEPNHYQCHAVSEENARFEHFIETGVWHNPGLGELLQFVHGMNWNHQRAGMLVNSMRVLQPN